MHWTRPAWTVAIFALALVSGCTDDEGPSAGESGSNNNTSSADESADETAGPPLSECLANAVGDASDDMASDPLMNTWGAPCSTDADCVALIGEGAVCDTLAVVYELPGGYCTKPCTLPDADTRFVLDDPVCDPNGGIACIGVMGQFERCGPPCLGDMQCNRDGYVCRLMPLIGVEGDPRMCLMPDCCLDGCE
ncbi:MAG: hypothetical protein K0V04_03265 [Deltaproteobacteria bacterium]|nr:hypothetical protein [Deltaproteobacteria bacterium]